MTSRSGYLIVTPWGPEALGGVSGVVTNLARELGALGREPTVLVNTWEAREVVWSVSGSIPLARMRLRPAWSRPHPVRAGLAFVLTFPVFAWRFRQMARSHGWGVVNVHYPGPSSYGLVLLRRLGLWKGRLVVSVHGSDVRHLIGPEHRAERALMTRILEGADAVVACSRELAQQVVTLAPRARNRTSIIHNGISLEWADREALPSPADSLPSGRFVLSVATFDPRKATDVLVDAFSTLADRTDADLVLVGRSGPSLDAIRRRVAEPDLAGRVHIFTDQPHDAVGGFLSRAAVFCVPSRSEGHPLALLEAAAFGLACVATPVGDVDSIIPDAAHGRLVPVGDVDALARALWDFLSDPASAAAAGDNLRRRVRAAFSWRHTAESYLAAAGRAP